ncbi:hypothetical protein Q9L58_005894 [Maublancomyces gigas]|uniref:Uncharacterized protein n=1 Tax=Discina gigas TaxID=1032678 RepID=A0ABR3GGU9_9PEZI
MPVPHESFPASKGPTHTDAPKAPNPSCSFTHLPTELVLEISSYLQRPAINALLRVSRHLASILAPILGHLGATAIDRIMFQRSLLHWAAANGKPEVLRLMLRHGADVHRRDSIGGTGLHYAVLCCRPATVSVLLEKGADAEESNSEGWPPLHLAAIRGSCEIVGLLLDYGVDINARTRSFNHQTALHYAALQGHCAVVELLIQRGANLSTKDWHDMTAGETAILAGQMEVVQLVFGLESEKQVELASVNLVRQYKNVEQDIGIVRRRIQLLLRIEALAVEFGG